MKAAPYMKLYVADYLADTTHLNTLENGAYLLLLLALWRAGGKLPRDDRKLARIARLSDAEWAEIAPTIIEFFTISGGVITQKRCSEELAKYEAVVSGSKRGGKASAAKRSNENNGKSPTDVEPMAQQKGNEPEPEPKIEEEAKASFVGSEIATEAGLFGDELVEGPEPVAKPKPWEANAAFQAFWSVSGPRMRSRSSQSKVWPDWKRVSGQIGAEQLIAALKRYTAEDADYQRTGGPGLHSWLKDGRWEHWLGSSADAGSAAPAHRFPDAKIREAFTAQSPDSLRWLDHCTMAGTQLIAPNEFIARQLQSEAGKLLKSLGVTGARIAKKEAA